jgi:hypothetical protein
MVEEVDSVFTGRVERVVEKMADGSSEVALGSSKDKLCWDNGLSFHGVSSFQSPH